MRRDHDGWDADARAREIEIPGDAELPAAPGRAPAGLATSAPFIAPFAKRFEATRARWRAEIERLTAAGHVCRRLQTSHAFHSALMEPVVERFLALFEGIELHPPEIPYLSNVTGGWITAEEATDPAYWADHLRGTVRFHENGQRAIEGTHEAGKKHGTWTEWDEDGKEVSKVEYDAGATDWLSAVLSTTSAPASLALTAATAGLSRGTYRASDNVTAYVQVDNVLDKDPEPAPGTSVSLGINPFLYDALGRTYRVGFRTNF